MQDHKESSIKIKNNIERIILNKKINNAHHNAYKLNNKIKRREIKETGHNKS